LSEEESPNLIEPAIEQEGNVGDVEDEEKSTTENDTEADNERILRASKNYLKR
jgi:hypothetical protein